MEKVPYIWMDGKLIKWDEANVHVLTHTLHYGLGVFEGIRCYECAGGKSAIFRLNEHMQRLFDSAHINLIKIPYSKAALIDATKEVIRANKLKSAYIRPIVFMGDGEMGLHATKNPIRVSIAAWPWGTYLGEDGVKNGIRAKISSFTRPTVNSIMNKSKTCGNYINSIWAKREALASGYEEAIMLDNEGYISEATGENFFMVKNGVVHTPALGNAILDGITRASLLTYLKDQKIQTIEGRITRDQAYLADEVFVCGTAAEITPIREIDDRTIGTGKPGPLTKQIQDFYFGVIRGKHPQYTEWLSFI